MYPSKQLDVNPLHSRYCALIGTGGIGSGLFFALDGNHTLGREESRSGHFLDRRDYCKLHIVSHYVRRLLGASFPVIPLGMVGADKRASGSGRDGGGRADVRYVGRAEGRGTLYALCLIYPDGSGGNVTENDSACAAVDAGWIARGEPNSPLRRCGDRAGAARSAVGGAVRNCWRWARRTGSSASPPSPLLKSSSWPAGSTRLTSWR